MWWKSNSFKLLWKSLLPTNEEDPFKNEGARVVKSGHNKSPIVSLFRFFMMLKGS